jgi:hypothetical protein
MTAKSRSKKRLPPPTKGGKKPPSPLPSPFKGKRPKNEWSR